MSQADILNYLNDAAINKTPLDQLIADLEAGNGKLAVLTKLSSTQGDCNAICQ